MVRFPTWDRDRQELRRGEYVVKQFKVPSPNQETILAAFEEEHRPPRIDDPLPPQFDQEPAGRTTPSTRSTATRKVRLFVSWATAADRGLGGSRPVAIRSGTESCPGGPPRRTG